MTIISYFYLLCNSITALLTFFAGLAVKPKNKADKWLKALMMILAGTKNKKKGLTSGEMCAILIGLSKWAATNDHYIELLSKLK